MTLTLTILAAITYTYALAYTLNATTNHGGHPQLLIAALLATIATTLLTTAY